MKAIHRVSNKLDLTLKAENLANKVDRFCPALVREGLEPDEIRYVLQAVSCGAHRGRKPHEVITLGKERAIKRGEISG